MCRNPDVGFLTENLARSCFAVTESPLTLGLVATVGAHFVALQD
jgi:hypothetical protein